MQGFEVVKQLLSKSHQPLTFVLGVRDVAKTQAAYSGFQFNRSVHTVTILPLDLSNLATVVTFAQQALSALASTNLNYLLLNAAISESAGTSTSGPNGSKWSKTYLVNHLCNYSRFPPCHHVN
jgi:NAD(P)-dependent dehydrogenase (short-subunit alcohol dehydrogenase family)